MAEVRGCPGVGHFESSGNFFFLFLLFRFSSALHHRDDSKARERKKSDDMEKKLIHESVESRDELERGEGDDPI